MPKYNSHSGVFYSNIGDGSDIEVDFAMIKPDDSKSGVMVLKFEEWVVVYNFTSLLYEKDKALVLLSKECDNNQEAYIKMMKIIGKMIKKSGSEFADGHIARYYNNRADKEYVTPTFVKNSMLMNPVYKAMKHLKTKYFKE